MYLYSLFFNSVLLVKDGTLQKERCHSNLHVNFTIQQNFFELLNEGSYEGISRTKMRFSEY